MRRTLAPVLFALSATYSSLLGSSSSDSESGGGGGARTRSGSGLYVLVDLSSSARAARVASSISSRPSGPSQSPIKRAEVVSTLSREPHHGVRKSDARLPLSVLSGTSALCLGFALRFSTTGKRPSKGSKRRGRMKRWLGAKVLCTNDLPHKAHEGQMNGRVLSWLRYEHTTDTEGQDRGHGISDVLV